MVFFLEGEACLIEGAVPCEGVVSCDPNGVLAVFGKGGGGFERSLDVVEGVGKGFAEVWDDNLLPVLCECFLGNEVPETTG